MVKGANASMRYRSYVGFALVLLLLAFPAAGFAQVLYGSLTGNVTDPSGAAVASAEIEALNVNTGVTYKATSDSNGIYRFVALLPGAYKITFTGLGFAKTVHENVPVSVNTVQRVDAQLTVAKINESVTVTAETPLLQTDKSDVHTDITATQISSLPLSSSQGRNFQSLYKLIPGAGLPTEANSSAGNPQRAISTNVNGQSIQTNNTRVDGATISYPWLPQNIAYVPPADAIETVNVVTNSFDAEQGTAGGASFNVQVKSGTNNFHGSLHEFHSDNLLKTKNYFFAENVIDPFTQQTVKQRKPQNVQNQFGGTIGGPVVKDKLFFFGDYERTLQRTVGTSTQSVFGDVNSASPGYWQKVRGGDFSGLATIIYDPATGNPDGSGRSQISCNGVLNVICPNRLDSAATKFMARVPAPNVVTANGLSNYFAAKPVQFTRDTFDVKVNYIPGQKSTVFGRYSFSKTNVLDPSTLGAAGGGAIGGGSAGAAHGRIQSVGLGATYAFTSNLLMDWNFGYTRQNLNAQNADLAQGKVGLDELGIPGTNGPTFLEGGIPAITFTSYSSLGNPDTGNPFLFRDNQFVTNANLNWTKGKHGFRFGMEVNVDQINHFQPQGGTFGTARGSLQFSGNATVGPTPAQVAAGTAVNPDLYNSLASFLLGYASQIGKATQTVNPISVRWKTWAAYARDQFQVTPKFTINYGLRWEYYPAAYSNGGRGVRFFDANPASPNYGKLVIGGMNGVPQDDGMDVGHGLFLPRVGLSYRLSEKTVVRAGYGMSADPNNWRFFRNNFPNIIATSIFGNNGYPGLTPTSPTTYIPAACTTGSQDTGICAHPLPSYPGLQVGVPAIPASLVQSFAGQAVLTLPNTVGTNTISNPFDRGYINSLNLTLQRDFLGFIGEVGYVGARAIRPLALVQLNTGTIGGGQDTAPFNILLGQTTGSNGTVAAPCATAINTPANPFARCRSGLGIGAYTPFKNSYYDSLQTKLTRRLGGGSQVGVVYTFGKAISYSDDEELQSLQFSLPAFYAKNKGPARFDRTHNLQIYGLYELPFGNGKRWANTGLAKSLAGGWQLNWVFSKLSGHPFTVLANNPNNTVGSTSNSANLIGPVRILGNTRGGGGSCGNLPGGQPDLSCRYFDTTAFASPATNAFGNTNRNFLRGPGYTNLDMSVFRNFKITERFTFQFRGEAFSVTNTPHFNTFGDNFMNTANISTAGSQFGVITQTLGGRLGTNLGGERNFWFSGKLIF